MNMSFYLRQWLLLACLAIALFPGLAQAGLSEYDLAIRTDSLAGFKPIATLTNATTFAKTNRLAFQFGSTSGNVSMEFIVEGNATAGGADAFLAVGANTSSSLRFEQYNNTGQMGFTLNGVADYLFSPAVPSPNIPVHITYVWTTNDSTMRLYLNGSLAGTQSSVNSTFQMPRGTGYLGNNPSGTEGLIGTIHRVTVYSGTLSPEKIQEHSDSWNGVRRPPEILSFKASPSTIFTPSTSTLTWQVSNVTAVFLTDQDVTSFTGVTVQPTVTTTYELIAVNDSGSSTSRVTIVVDPAPSITSFTATPQLVPFGKPTLFQWTTLHTDALTLSPGSLPLSPTLQGTTSLTPPRTETYQLTASNRFGTTTAPIQITVVQPSPHLVISEFLTDNSSSLVDEDGEHSDWIELANPTSQSIQLQGHYLTDNPNDPTRWPLPPLQLAPGAFQIVFASGKNRINPQRPLHTNFKLNQISGFLGLTDASGRIIQSFDNPYPPQSQDVSYGILGGDPALTRFFTPPTPGSENTDSPLPPRQVEFSHPSGTFSTAFSLSLTTESTNALIYYTLNGSEPSTTHGLPYTGPILIDSTRQIRALCIRSNLTSELSSASYIRLAPELQSYSSTLPILVIENFGAGQIPQKGWSGNGSGIRQRPRQPAIWATFDRSQGASSLTNRPQMFSRIGIRGRGAFSSSWRQPPYSVDTWDAADGNNNISPLGMPAHSEWILYFPDADENKDPALLFNTFAYDLSRDMGGRYSVRFRWVETFVNEDGGDLKLSDRRGIYAIVEKVARGKNRLNFNPLSPDGSTGGWLLNLNRMDPEPENGWPAPNGARQPWFFHTAGPNRKLESPPNSQVSGDDIPQQSNGYLNFDTPNGYTIQTNQRIAIENWFKTFEDALYNNAVWRHPTLGYRQYLDTRDFIDYFILNVLTHNGDGLLISMFPWKGDDNKLRMGPAWDYNWSAYYVSGSATADLMHRSEQLWYPRLFNDPDFKQEYIDRWWQLRSTALHSTNFDAIIDRQVADIGLPQSTLNGMPSSQEWLTRISTLKSWLKTRANAIDALYLRPPEFSSRGGLVNSGFQLALSATNGTIYYTIDGSDPRSPGGAISPNARAYDALILINTPTTVKARIVKGSNWSGLTDASFFTPEDFSALTLTEIHYNPDPFGLFPGDELEFLELQNRGSTPLNLGGLRFTSGISFTFPAPSTLAPGEFFVLARNKQAMESRHPGVTINGLYTDKLSNSGETITLSTPGGGVLLSLTYNDRAPWPLAADGWGFSLVPRQMAPIHSHLGTDWRASSMPGGSPGAPDPEVLPHAVLINEIVPASTKANSSDTIELFNPGIVPVDVSGWFLSDDATQPQKVRLPSLQPILPGGFLLLTEADFNPEPGSPHSFALSASGESIYLSSGDSQGHLTGYSHGFSFDASDPNTSFGRHVNSVGQEQFPPQQAITLGSSNSSPQPGTVILQEISYHPGIDADEFVEIQNITDQTVALFHPVETTNTWRISGLGFQFPTNIFLPPHTIALVTKDLPTSFRNRFAIPHNVPIFGPYTGSLQGSGETLKIQRPSLSTPTGVPYITVDAVTYDDRYPWPPAADGSGASLQKLVPSRYGNDPAEWTAALPTPGAPLPSIQSVVALPQPPQIIFPNTETAEISISASGSPPLFHQWLFQGKPIPDATNSILRIAPLQVAATGDYTVIVYNSFSSAQSIAVTLNMPERPQIYLQPQSRTANAGTTASFTVGALGTTTLSYQWLKDHLPIPLATNATLVLTNIQPSHEGTYQVTVSTPTSRITSEPASLSVIVKPSLLTTLPNQTLVAGDTLQLRLHANGTPPFTVRWRRATTTLASALVNSTNLSFTLTNIQPNQSGKYTALLSNPAGSNIPSNEAIITVLADSDRDHIPDAYESSTPGLNPSLASDATLDFDLDGFSNLQEYQAGTDPNNASSFLKWDLIQHTPQGILLRFQAVSNHTYSIQFKPDAEGSVWTSGWIVPAMPQTRTEEILDSTPQPEGRFYRLRTPE